MGILCALVNGQDQNYEQTRYKSVHVLPVR
jgi:hypothetical protein